MSGTRESALLRGPSAAQAAPYLRDLAASTAPPVREVAAETPAVPEQPPAPERRAPERDGDVPVVTERRTAIRRAADQPVPSSGLRLGDVYAEELARLREHAHAQGYAAGFAEGSAAAATVVARAEAEARARMAEAHARWERRLVSATAALGAAARRLEDAAAPVAEDVRDSILGAVLTLVEDLLGRELALAESPGVDAIRRALTLLPADAPVVVRLHPDDLAEVPEAALAELPDTVTVVGDERVEHAGAVAETGSQRVDAQLGPALERVQAVLAP